VFRDGIETGMMQAPKALVALRDSVADILTAFG